MMTLPSLRRFGAEHSPLECVCGRASPVVSTEEQRFIPMKCLTCAVTLASNKPSLSDNERLRQKAARIEREQREISRLAVEARLEAERKEKLRVEEERRSNEILEARKRALAKHKRVEYSRMFRPPVEAIEPLTAGQRDAVLLEPVPEQLDSLLPIAVGSKREFQEAVKHYRKSRRRLKKIYKTETAKRLAAEAAEIQLRADAALAAKHASLIRMSLERLGFRQLNRCFHSWKVRWALKKKLSTHLTRKRLENLQVMFRHWKRYRRERSYKKACSAVLIQASSRKIRAKAYVRKLIVMNRAANIINSFARVCLAKNLLRLAKKRMRRNDDAVRGCLAKLMRNSQTVTFREWKAHVKKMNTVRRFIAKGDMGRLANHFLLWQRYTSISKRKKKKKAAEFLGRVGKGFIARLYAARARIQKRAAIRIQCMYRSARARTALKIKLRQHRILKKKMRRHLSGTKRECFDRWLDFIRSRRILLMMIGKNNRTRLRDAFLLWVSRREGALIIQRVFRGAMSRQRVTRIRLKVMKARQVGKAKLASSVLFDDSLSSPTLELLRSEYLRVKDTSFTESKYTLNLHGAPQLFNIKKHKDLVLSILAREIEKEICRLKEQQHALKETLRAEAEAWEQTLEKHLVAPDFTRLDRFDAYKNVGKSFDFKSVSKAFTIETLDTWKEMYDLKYITKWTFVGWIAQAFLLRKGVRAIERNCTWELIQAKLDASFVEDLATYTLYRIRKPRQLAVPGREHKMGGTSFLRKPSI